MTSPDNFRKKSKRRIIFDDDDNLDLNFDDDEDDLLNLIQDASPQVAFQKEKNESRNSKVAPSKLGNELSQIANFATIHESNKSEKRVENPIAHDTTIPFGKVSGNKFQKFAFSGQTPHIDDLRDWAKNSKISDIAQIQNKTLPPKQSSTSGQAKPQGKTHENHNFIEEVNTSLDESIESITREKQETFIEGGATNPQRPPSPECSLFDEEIIHPFDGRKNYNNDTNINNNFTSNHEIHDSKINTYNPNHKHVQPNFQEEMYSNRIPHYPTVRFDVTSEPNLQKRSREGYIAESNKRPRYEKPPKNHLSKLIDNDDDLDHLLIRPTQFSQGGDFDDENEELDAEDLMKVWEESGRIVCAGPLRDLMLASNNGEPLHEAVPKLNSNTREKKDDRISFDNYANCKPRLRIHEYIDEHKLQNEVYTIQQVIQEPDLFTEQIPYMFLTNIRYNHQVSTSSLHCITLADGTGEIDAIISSNVDKKTKDHLLDTGVTMLLRNVDLLHIAAQKFCIVIGPKSILRMASPYNAPRLILKLKNKRNIYEGSSQHSLDGY